MCRKAQFQPQDVTSRGVMARTQKAVKKTPKFILLTIHKIGSQPSNKASGNKMEQYKNSQKSAH